MKEIYFRDNFFSKGETEIYNENKELIGYIDLQSMFTSTLAVYSLDREPLLKGNFKFFSNKWYISDVEKNQEIGRVRPRFSFFEKHFEYEAYNRGVYKITSPIFSREYRITDMNNQAVAAFDRVNGFFESAAFRLKNDSDQLTWLELIVMIMGVNEIQKRQRQANSAN